MEINTGNKCLGRNSFVIDGDLCPGLFPYCLIFFKRKKATRIYIGQKEFFFLFLNTGKIAAPEVQATGSRFALLFASLTVLQLFFIAKTKEVTGNDANYNCSLCFFTNFVFAATSYLLRRTWQDRFSL